MKRSILGVVVVVLALAGCTPTDVPTPTPTPSATNVSSSPPATPSPTVAPLTRPTLDQLALTPTGFAELPLGSNPASFDPSTSIVELRSYECYPGAPETITEWLPVDSDPDERLVAFYPSVNDAGVVSSIQVTSKLIKTDRGIGIGSTRAELLVAYPGIEVTESDERWDVYVVEGQTSWMRMAISTYESRSGLAPAAQDTVEDLTAANSGGQQFVPGNHPFSILECL